MSKERSIKTLELDGGCNAFHFVNTVHSSVDENIYDYLNSYEDLIDWMEKINLLPVEKLRLLKKRAQGNTKDAEKALTEIKKKRELLYNFFSNFIQNIEPGADVVKSVNKSLSTALSALSFNYNNGEFELGWETTEPDFYDPLNVIFKNVFDILTTIPKSRFKECKACGWLFLDKSKNNSRAWCSMQSCGSIDKAKRYYYRKKSRSEQ